MASKLIAAIFAFALSLTAIAAADVLPLTNTSFAGASLAGWSVTAVYSVSSGYDCNGNYVGTSGPFTRASTYMSAVASPDSDADGGAFQFLSPGGESAYCAYDLYQTFTIPKTGVASVTVHYMGSPHGSCGTYAPTPTEIITAAVDKIPNIQSQPDAYTEQQNITLDGTWHAITIALSTVNAGSHTLYIGFTSYCMMSFTQTAAASTIYADAINSSIITGGAGSFMGAW